MLTPVFSVQTAPQRIEGEVVAGAILAGLALSENSFHLRTSLDRTNLFYAKFRV